MRWCDDDLGFLIGCTHRALRARLLERLSALDLNFEQYQTLVALSVGDNVPQNVIAARLCLEATYTTRMVRRAEKHGLVTRARDEKDTRVVRVSLTPRGRAMWKRAGLLRAEFLEEALSCLEPSDRPALQRALVTLRDCLSLEPREHD